MRLTCMVRRLPCCAGCFVADTARRASGYRQLFLEIDRVITTAFAAAGLDGCVQSGPHYYLVGTTLAGHWRAVQTALLMRLLTKLHADDTTVPVLAAGHGQTTTGRLWTYVRDDRSAASTIPPAVWFAYTPDRKGIHPQTHLAGFHGILQADAYAGFNAIYDTGRVLEAACWAHTRRKFHDLHVVHPTAFTTEVLRRIGELYEIEELLRGKPPDVRRQVRQAQALPLLVDFEAWLRARLPTLSAKSDTTKAINYALNQWQALLLYCDHGIAEIDNNAAERALRGVALGRKNFLFVGADSGGERAAAMYALIGTAKLNGIDPEAYPPQSTDGHS